jgi:hypothetical protein
VTYHGSKKEGRKKDSEEGRQEGRSKKKGRSKKEEEITFFSRPLFGGNLLVIHREVLFLHEMRL